jgi:hypothetical protein
MALLDRRLPGSLELLRHGGFVDPPRARRFGKD